MQLITPAHMIFFAAWTAFAAITLAVFVTGYRREDRQLMAMGFVLSGIAGALLDYGVQMLRLAVVFS